MMEHIKAFFPKLADGAFRVTSDRDQAYNCIAWAAGATNRRWWPLENPDEAYWPEGAPASSHRWKHSRRCSRPRDTRFAYDDENEAGFEKVAFFVDGRGLPTHAARQVAGGKWTSKLGKAEDIEHDLRDLEDGLYGTVGLMMKRQRGEQTTSGATGGVP